MTDLPAWPSPPSGGGGPGAAVGDRIHVIGPLAPAQYVVLATGSHDNDISALLAPPESVVLGGATFSLDNVTGYITITERAFVQFAFSVTLDHVDPGTEANGYAYMYPVADDVDDFVYYPVANPNQMLTVGNNDGTPGVAGSIEPRWFEAGEQMYPGFYAYDISNTNAVTRLEVIGWRLA